MTTNENVKKSGARTLVGTVVSNKMKDTIVVLVERRVPHAKYGKIITRTSKIHAHDQGNQCSLGDKVLLKECRPISKTKAWLLAEIQEKVVV